jgi:hypothetical protein
VYLIVCIGVTLLATLVPRERAIAAACIVIFLGFLVAAPLHLAGW